MDRRLKDRLPLIAVLRGLEPDRALEVTAALADAGIEIIEIPMHSPDPLKSVGKIASRFSDQLLVGAGAVTSPGQVDDLCAVGAQLIVSPNCNARVIERTVSRGLVSLPGVLTPSEMLAALDAGANGLKIFPAEMAWPAGVKAMRSVLPANLPAFAVGGIKAGNIAKYVAAGAKGFGIGGALFKPDKPIVEIASDARAMVAAYTSAMGSHFHIRNGEMKFPLLQGASNLCLSP